MKPECPKFEPQQAQERILRFGYTSVPIDHSEAEIRAFAAQNGASVFKGFFNWVLRKQDSLMETPEEKAEKFEKIRQENLARRIKLAASRKKKEATK